MIKKINTFSIEYKSEMEQKTYQGQFTSRIATVMDKSKINVRRSQLNGGMYCHKDDQDVPTGRGIDETTEYMNHVIAFLEIVLMQKPVWWVLEGEGAITEWDLIEAVFKEVMSFENSFRTGGRSTSESKGSSQSSEGNGQTKPSQANLGDNAPKVVDRQVQTALDP